MVVDQHGKDQDWSEASCGPVAELATAACGPRRKDGRPAHIDCMTAISAHSISTRELSRQSDGKFGTQSHTAQGCELTGTLSTDAVREYLESLGHDPEIVDGLLHDIPDGTLWSDQAIEDLAANAEAMRADGSDVTIGTVFSNVDIKERAAQIERELLESVGKIVAEGKLKDFMDLVAANRMSSWSFGNQMLAHLQGMGRRGAATPEELAECPPDLMIMSASAWKRTFKRHPRPGSKAIWILRPKSITKGSRRCADKSLPMVPGRQRRPARRSCECWR